ncbi:RipA family octameric membrane protein [Nonomuraea bangladeshensis]|uniref:RipA family octameric membrane protein n=1 Tax=Nonomuraea bangladeshensis TaxID=404385 RepID=UPI003C2F279B
MPDLKKRLHAYFGTAPPPTPESVRAALWAEDTPDQVVLLEQYKLYVEMADRVSARRGLTNTFFLTLNAALFALIGTLMTRESAVASWILFFPLLAMLLQCFAWFWLLRSYRQLNAAKYAVVGALEERLPASPYWRAEWEALGRGTDPARYWPLSHLEQWVPLLFAAVYTITFLGVVLI